MGTVQDSLTELQLRCGDNLADSGSISKSQNCCGSAHFEAPKLAELEETGICQPHLGNKPDQQSSPP